jgi:hypothetical protein
MQRGDSRGFGSARVSDVRAQLRAQSEKQKPENHAVGKPPKPRRGAAVDVREERAAMAEKLAAMHHSTSLLAKEPKNSRSRAYKEPKRGGGFFWQLLVVMAVAGGVAYALDPSMANSVVSSIDWQALKEAAGIKG